MRNGKEEERQKFLWLGVFFFMSVFLIVWLWNFDMNLRKMTDFRLDFSLPEIPQDLSIDGAKSVISEGEKALDNVGDGMDENFWKAKGEEYLVQKDFFVEEEFSELRLVSVEERESLTVLSYEQYYKSVPVVGGGVDMYFNLNGDFEKLDETLRKNVDIIIEPEMSAQKAKGAAEYYLNNSDFVFKKSNLVIVSFQDKYYLVWDLFFEDQKDSGEKEIFVGARNGSIILPEQLDK